MACFSPPARYETCAKKSVHSCVAIYSCANTCSQRAQLMMVCRFSAATQGHSHGRVVFKYKLQAGACPKSYGLHVAALAGIPPQICHLADQVGRYAALHGVLLSRSVSQACRSAQYTHVALALDMLHQVLLTCSGKMCIVLSSA